MSANAREVSATEARAQWAQLIRDARAGEPVVVTQHGEAAVVLVDVVWWRRATVALAVESPQAQGSEPFQGSSWERARSEIKAEVGDQVIKRVREEIFSPRTLRRVLQVSETDHLTLDQVVNAGLDQREREQRRRRLREESQAVLADPADLAEVRAVQEEMGELRAW